MNPILIKNSIHKAGNIVKLNSIIIKIDKTAPELVMQFDPNAKQIKGSGEDSVSGIDTVTQTTTGPTVKD